MRHYLQSNETSFLDAQLLSQWPNLRNREKRGLKCDGFGSDWLWTQSWCQHGALKPNRFNRKCSKKAKRTLVLAISTSIFLVLICSIKSPYSYFKQTLNIANRWDIFGILAAEQIKPHDRNTYTLKQLNEALLKKAGAVGAESPNTKYFSVGLQMLKMKLFLPVFVLKCI